MGTTSCIMPTTWPYPMANCNDITIQYLCFVYYCLSLSTFAVLTTCAPYIYCSLKMQLQYKCVNIVMPCYFLRVTHNMQLFHICKKINRTKMINFTVRISYALSNLKPISCQPQFQQTVRYYMCK